MSPILNVNKNYIYNKEVNDIRIRSICNWWQNGEKPSKFFLNLEKYRATQGYLRMIIVTKKELSTKEECIQSFLDEMSLPKLNENQTLNVNF